MIGDASVGKTSLTVRYVSGTFMEDLKLTIGVDFYSKIIECKNQLVKLQIWDFGGEERFRFLLSQYCKGADGCFFLYDITNKISFDHLPEWTKIIREHAGNIPITLIGSKVDLDEFRMVPPEDGVTAAQKYNLDGFLELSSKTGKKVNDAFIHITEILLKKSAPNLFD